MGKQRGNPNWGKLEPIKVAVLPSEFETVVKSLRLSPAQYQSSAALRDWVKKNKDQKYVPQDVLDAFGFDVRGEI